MKALIRLALTASLFIVATAAANAQNGYSAAGYYAGPQAQAAYIAQQQAYARGWARYYADQAAARQAAAQRAAAPRPVVANSQIRFDGRFAAVGQTAPKALQFAVYAANTLQDKSYGLGRGHHYLEDSAYDCSSSTSYILFKAGLLNRCLSSREFASYGQAGTGRFITIWVKPGEHVFITICGLRMDTSGQVTGEGPRWRTEGRNYAGFSPRHPVGL